MEDKKEFEPLENDWSSMSVAPAAKFGTVIKAGDPAIKDRVSAYHPISLSNAKLSGGAQVELLRDHDAVTAIRFRCECGCETTVELVVD